MGTKFRGRIAGFSRRTDAWRSRRALGRWVPLERGFE